MGFGGSGFAEKHAGGRQAASTNRGRPPGTNLPRESRGQIPMGLGFRFGGRGLGFRV